MRTVDFPFDNYILFDNGVISEVMYIDKKKLKRAGKHYVYEYVDYETPDSCHLVKKKLKPLFMSDNKHELEEYKMNNID